jgi:hypothetical protein
VIPSKTKKRPRHPRSRRPELEPEVGRDDREMMMARRASQYLHLPLHEGLQADPAWWAALGFGWEVNDGFGSGLEEAYLDILPDYDHGE